MEKSNSYNYPSGKIGIPPFIDEEGIFTVTLINKVWGKKSNLICVFEKEDGTIFSTTAWRKGLPAKEIYSPKKGDLDFKEVARGTRWNCVFTLSKNEKYYDWIEAILIE